MHSWLLLRSKLSTDAAREFGVRSLGLGQISCLIEALARLEQVRGQTGPADVDAEAFDQAITLDDRAAGLPEGASLVWARFGPALCDESKRALLGVNLAHARSVERGRNCDIGPGTDLTAAFY